MSSRSQDEPRRIPTQERGERRVAQLLEAAAAEISTAGYEAATMSAIAGRAGAPIGSLYQFFPNKRAITQALRIEYGKDYEVLLIQLRAEAPHFSADELATRLIQMSVHFVESHPAFLQLLDAPPSTRSPITLHNTIRDHLAHCFIAVKPRLAKAKAQRLAAVTLQLVKGLNQLYAESPAADQRMIVTEFRMAVSSYLTARLEANT